MSDNDIHFSRSELLQRLGGDEQLLEELLTMAHEDFPAYLDALDSACSADDSEQFRRAAHKLKGFARNLAFTRLAELSLQAENSVDQATADCRSCIAAIKQEIAELLDVLDEYYHTPQK